MTDKDEVIIRYINPRFSSCSWEDDSFTSEALVELAHKINEIIDYLNINPNGECQ